MLLVKLISYLPLSVLYFITDGLGILIYYLIRYRRDTVIANIKNAFPDKTDVEINHIARNFYRRFTEYMAETIKGITISEDEMKRRVRFTNTHVLQSYADANQSVILAGGHQFNWEWALLTGCLVLPFPVDAVYQKLSNEKFDKLMFEMRGKFGGHPIDKKYIIRTLLKTKSRVRALAIVADQSPRKKAVKYWSKFLNQDTAFLTGIEQIAFAMNYPVYFYHMRRIKRGHYTVELIPIASPPYDKGSHEILEAFIKKSEKQIIEDPAGYLWTHKRWKLQREELT